MIRIKEVFTGTKLNPLKSVNLFPCRTESWIKLFNLQNAQSDQLITEWKVIESEFYLWLTKIWDKWTLYSYCIWNGDLLQARKVERSRFSMYNALYPSPFSGVLTQEPQMKNDCAFVHLNYMHNINCTKTQS